MIFLLVRDDEENMIEKSGCHVSKKIDHTTSIDYAEVVRVEDHLTGISSLSSSESEDVKETFGISVSLEKGTTARTLFSQILLMYILEEIA